MDKETKDIVDCLTDFGEETRKDKSIDIKKINNRVDNIANVFYELFPVPWCA
jgi:hypothetical protein